MKKIKKYLGIVFIFIFAILIYNSNQNFNGSYKAEEGILDLSNCNLSKDKYIKLQGKWKLYYGELLNPEEIKTKDSSNYYSIPGKLRDQVQGKTKGYMTLHLKLKLPDNQSYGIYCDSMFTASKTWINGNALDEHGVVGMDMKNEKAIYRPQYIFFNPINKEADIVVQTSTFRDIEPALKASILGTKEQIVKLTHKNMWIDGFIMGLMLIMGILNFGFYFTEPKQKRNLYFAMICLIMLFRTSVLNSRIFVQLYPTMDYEVLSKTAAITFYLSVTFYVLFLDDIFENRIRIKKYAVEFGIIFTTLCLVTKNTFYDRLDVLLVTITAIFAVYLLIFILKEMKKKNKIASKNLWLFIIVCITASNDIGINNSSLYSKYMIQYGIIAYIIVQSVFIVDDYLEKHRKLERIHRDGLTSLYNNKYIKDILSKCLNVYNEKEESFSVIMIDVDDFKEINDNYGHMFGDTVIMDVANILSDVTDEIGYAGRFGGDEFIIILPKTTEKEAINIAENIMFKVKELNHRYSIERKISISIGVCENNSKELTECINNVDNLLYKAKASGKESINGTSELVYF